MRIQSLILPVAVAAALSVSSGAMAQRQAIPVDDLPKVFQLCQSLAEEATGSLASTDEGDSEEESSGLDQALTQVDLDAITLEECKKWGFVDTNRVLVE